MEKDIFMSEKLESLTNTNKGTNNKEKSKEKFDAYKSKFIQTFEVEKEKIENLLEEGVIDVRLYQKDKVEIQVQDNICREPTQYFTITFLKNEIEFKNEKNYSVEIQKKGNIDIITFIQDYNFSTNEYFFFNKEDIGATPKSIDVYEYVLGVFIKHIEDNFIKKSVLPNKNNW